MTKKKKYYYYVLVFTDTGPVYVTGIGERYTAFWNRLKPPYELEMHKAEDVAMGLGLNGTSAVMVKSPYDLTFQPYYYHKFDFIIKPKEDANAKKDSE